MRRSRRTFLISGTSAAVPRGESRSPRQPKRRQVGGGDPELDPPHRELIERVCAEQRQGSARDSAAPDRRRDPVAGRAAASGRSMLCSPTAPSSRSSSASAITDSNPSRPRARCAPPVATVWHRSRHTDREACVARDLRVLCGRDDVRDVGLGDEPQSDHPSPRPSTGNSIAVGLTGEAQAGAAVPACRRSTTTSTISPMIRLTSKSRGV